MDDEEAREFPWAKDFRKFAKGLEDPFLDKHSLTREQTGEFRRLVKTLEQRLKKLEDNTPKVECENTEAVSKALALLNDIVVARRLYFKAKRCDSGQDLGTMTSGDRGLLPPSSSFGECAPPSQTKWRFVPVWTFPGAWRSRTRSSS